MLGKNLTPFTVRKNNSITRGLGKNSYPNRIDPLRPKVIFSLRDSENTLIYFNQPWIIRKVMGEGGAKAKKKFPQEILNKKNIFLQILPRKNICPRRKKKNISTLHVQKKNLASLKIPTPSFPHPSLRRRKSAALKQGIRKWKRNTEYGIRERRFQAIDLKKIYIGNEIK